MTTQTKKRPPAWSATGRVWAIADEMMAATGVVPSGRAVVDCYLAEAEGRNEGTGFTQFSYWKRAATAPHQRKPQALPRQPLRLGADGSLLLPPGIVQMLGMPAGGILVASIEGARVILEPANLALQRARDLVRAFDTGSGSPVDELIAERRREAIE